MSLSYVVAMATPTTIAVTKTRCFIGTTATSPTADTFTEIGGVTEIPAYGPSDSPVLTSTIPSGIELTDHGVTKLGGGTLKCVMDVADAGQLALVAAQLVKAGNYNFRMIFPNGVTANPSDPSVSHGTITDLKVKVLSASVPTATSAGVYMLEFAFGYNTVPAVTAAT